MQGQVRLRLVEAEAEVVFLSEACRDALSLWRQGRMVERARVTIRWEGSEGDWDRMVGEVGVRDPRAQHLYGCQLLLLTKSSEEESPLHLVSQGHSSVQTPLPFAVALHDRPFRRTAVVEGVMGLGTEPEEAIATGALSAHQEQHQARRPIEGASLLVGRPKTGRHRVHHVCYPYQNHGPFLLYGGHRPFRDTLLVH